MISAESALEFDVVKLELEEIWPQADYITVHTPLIPQTKSKFAINRLFIYIKNKKKSN